MKTIKDFNVQGKRILVRCDFNVPLNNNRSIAFDFKIKKTLPTIKYLLKNNARIILMSHLDNPDSTVTENLDVIKIRLEQLLGMLIKKTDDCVGKEVEKEVAKLKDGEILLLENVRFHKEEFDNDPTFGRNLAKLGDIYIDDAFAVSHRPHASIIGVPRYIPFGAGLLMEEEIDALDRILKYPKHPFVALIGGKNVKTKSSFIDSISRSADFVIISGLIKKEIQEKEFIFKYRDKIVGPEENLEALDIDKKTIIAFKKKISGAKTIVWNGPFGMFEDEKYKKGTLEIAKAMIKSRAFSIVGGGETLELLHKEGLLSDFSHVSTGGGAMLAYLAGEMMPGIEAIK